MGRPTDCPKDTLINVRMDRNTVEKLDYLVKAKGVSKSDVIRDGIEIQYKEKIRSTD